ncbi:hypothetical protein [Butyrivibrio sp. AE3009]|uniref:hypothetical protein n=1 Tax=Butyrivibrio sp. AE3009 TaxID=1280666 RepID=UPI0012DBFC61|nr:hypothetical protein [Butyrivibrio sp. AE3009]
MKRCKHTQRSMRMLSLLLTLVMMLSMNTRAFAANEFTEEAYTEAEEFALDEEYAEEYEDDGDDYIATPEDIDKLLGNTTEEGTYDEVFTEEDALEESALEESTLEEEPVSEEIQEDAEEVLLEDATDEAVPGVEDSNIQTALSLLKSSGSLPNLKAGDANIPTDKFAVTRYTNYVRVENKFTGNDAPKLYAALIYATPDQYKETALLGFEIAPGKSIKLSSVYTPQTDKDAVNEKSDYTLWIGYADTDDEGTPYSFKILGYIPRYDNAGNEVLVDGNPVYDRAVMDEVSLPATNVVNPASDTTWADGYEGIKMKALIQKNLTSVKISWAPDTKNKPEQKSYKKYALYHLEEDTTQETGYKEDLIKELKSKSITIKNVDTEADSLLYLLKCMDADGNVLAQYVTAAAPYMLQMQSGNETGEFSYTMTQRPDIAQAYYVELAAKNKEADVKTPTGFQEAWRTTYNLDPGFNQGNSIGQFFVNKKTTPDAIMLNYEADAPEVTIGTTYYGRVRTVTYVNTLKVVSAPSNVLSCKAGPDRCYVLTSAGVYYDTRDAKKGNKYNLARANEHINSYVDGYDVPLASQMYVHGTNYSVCAKSGLIYFLVKKEHIGDIKSFDLLKCDHENGVYKKVKNYTFKNTALMECTIEGNYLSDYKIFAMYYNKFTPEKEAYYSVRAISTTKNTPGGWGIGELIVPEMDEVQGLITSDGGSDRIVLMWLADDCVKQYWLYRSDKPFKGETRESVTQNGEVLVAKIGISKAKKLDTFPTEEEDNPKSIKYITYTDKKNIKINTPYYYYVRPVYNTTAATKDSSAYITKISDEIMGKASALYAQVKNFKVTNAATKKVKLSFTQLKNIDQYRVFRLEVDSDIKKLTEDMKPKIDELYAEAEAAGKTELADIEDYISQLSADRWKEFIQKFGVGSYRWTYIDTIGTSGTSTKALTWTDTSVKVGKYYFYLVQPATAPKTSQDKTASSSIYFTYSSRIMNRPLAVDNARIAYENSGIKLTYAYNSRETDRSNLHVELSLDDGKHYYLVPNGSYIHKNPKRGTELKYMLRVRYDDGTDSAVSDAVELKYSLPSSIEVTRTAGSGEFNNNTFTLKKGQEATISYKAIMSSGGTPTKGSVSRSATPDGNEVLTNIQSGNNSFSFTANKKGTVSYTLSCEGLSRTITIQVTE